MMDLLYSLYIKIISIGFLEITPETQEGYKAIHEQFELWINGFAGLSFLISIGVMMIHVLKLANAGDNAQKRSQALRDIMITGITTSGLGGIGIIYVIIFYIGF